MNLQQQQRSDELEEEMENHLIEAKRYQATLNEILDKADKAKDEYYTLQEKLSIQCTIDGCETLQALGDDLCSEHLKQAISEDERKADRKTRIL